MYNVAIRIRLGDTVMVTRLLLIVACGLAFGAARADNNPPPLLSDSDRAVFEKQIPDAPSANGADDLRDWDSVLATRDLLKGTRGAEATEDNVFPADQSAARFQEAAGFPLTRTLEPTLFALIDQLAADGTKIFDDLKAKSGRKRPFVAHPDLQTCAGADSLKNSPSYPSGHAFLGMTWALVLSDVAPDRAAALYDRGVAFGESRMICGFHYPTDLIAGRLSAILLHQQLSAKLAAQLAAAKSEVAAARHHH